MRKIYTLITLLMVAISVNAADKMVMVVSADSVETNAIIQSLVDMVDAIEGVTAEHVLQADYSIMTDFSAYHAVFLTENGGSSSAIAVQDAGWQVPVIHLKTYALYKGTNPIFAQADVEWYADKGTEWRDGDGTLIVKDASDILSMYAADDEVEWTTAFNDETGMGEAHVQAFDLSLSAVTDIANAATLLSENKWHSEEGVTASNMWKVDANGLTQKIFIWGIHQEFLQYATEDFYKIMTNATRWALDMEILNVDRVTTENKYNMYPNPMSDHLNIDNTSEVNSVSIYDISGKAVLSVSNDGMDRMNIHTASLVDGVYLIRLGSANGDFYHQKLVK